MSCMTAITEGAASVTELSEIPNHACIQSKSWKTKKPGFQVVNPPVDDLTPCLTGLQAPRAAAFPACPAFCGVCLWFLVWEPLSSESACMQLQPCLVAIQLT